MKLTAEQINLLAEENVYNGTEVSKFTGLTKQSISIAAKSKELFSIRFGKELMIPERALTYWWYHRPCTREFFVYLQQRGYGTLTLDELVKELDALGGP